ncbi:hypothetical protein H4582DRAFT_1920442 [Lactarius indigo]|nr:hypothetical protein H4582DRAFT_1920442 [Lactarius indigo]
MSLTTSTATQQGSLVTLMPPKPSAKAQRPPLDPIVIAARPHHSRIVNHRHTTSLVSASPPNISSPEPSHHSLERHPSSPSRKRSGSRRQSTISYLPADSPRLWSPRTLEKGSNALKRSVSLHNKKETRASTGSIPQRPTHQPAVSLPRHADLLQFIAQKESKCLELRSQLAAHESELNDLKRKWERIVHREFGRNLSPTSSSTSPMASPPPNSGAGAVFNGLAGGVRAIAAVAASPTPASPLARRMARQAASSSVSSTVTTTSGSGTSTGMGTRLSQSSASSVAEEKTDTLEEPIVRDTGATTPSEQPPSPSIKTLRRRSRDARVPLSDALSSLTGVSTSPASTKRASVGAVPPTSIPGINSLGAMGLGRTNLGEAAQGLMDSVGSRLAELQRGQTFSKSQKRASVLFSEVSQSIFSALGPAPSAPKEVLPTSPMQSLIDEDDEVGSTVLGHAILPDTVAVSRRPTPSKQPPLSRPETKDDEDDEDWNW